MATTTIQTSFSAGELSPQLFARVDFDKFKVGAALMRNFFVDFRGGASTRAGTQFGSQCYTGQVGTTRRRLIPFVVSETQAYVVEVGNLYMRFISNNQMVGTDGVPFVLATPYAGADIPLLKFVQSADVLTITHPNYAPMNLTRTTPSTFTLSALVKGSTIGPPTGLIGTPSITGTNQIGYVVTAMSEDGTQESIASNAYVVTNTTYLNMNYSPSGSAPSDAVITLTWTAPSGNPSQYNIYKWGPTPGPGSAHPAGAQTVYGYIGNSQNTSFIDTNVAPDFTRVPPQYKDPFSGGQVTSVTVTAGGSGYTGQYVPLTFTGDGTGATGYGLVDPGSGDISAVIMTNSGENYTECTVTPASGAATFTANLGPAAGTFPAAVSFFQQREVFAGPAGNPLGMVLSQPGSYGNFNTTPVTKDDDSITLSIASSRVNTIKSMVEMPTGLVVFTNGSAALINGGSKGVAITPSSILALPQASIGANDMPPITVNYDILYVQSKGSKVRDLAFSYYLQSYEGSDRTTLSNHLFFNQTLTEWAWSAEPFQVLYCVRADGQLLTMTYVREQEVYGWAHHDTQGLFQSVCTIPENNQDVIYFIVQRYINGSWVEYIERLDNRLFTAGVDAWCVDCGLAAPMQYPASSLTMDRVSGTNVEVTSEDAAVLGDVAVGDIIWAGGGQGQVVSLIDSSHVRVNWLVPVTNAIPIPYGSPAGAVPTPLPCAAGSWSTATPITRVQTPAHLVGQVLTGIADGQVIVPQVGVAGGYINLPGPSTKVVVGLGFQAQFQTLYLDMQIEGGTIQGKRKLLPAVTFRIDKTAGLKVGTGFNNMVTLRDGIIPDAPNAVVSRDIRTILPAMWDKAGQICVQQDLPLPASVLGIIMEVAVGDTQR